MKTKYWIIGAIVLVLGLFWWSRSMNSVNEVPPTRDFPVPKITEVSEFDHVQGAASTTVGLVRIVEYADYQCPGCGAYYPVVKELVASSSNMQLVYRNFPLPMHFNARKAAMAAEAANLQGKFWEMHDMLFENQSTWSTAVNANKIFIDYAKTLGLDTVKFEADLASGDLRLRIDKDLESGNQNGVKGTPSFFVNGKQIDMSTIKTFEEFKSAVIAMAGK